MLASLIVEEAKLAPQAKVLYFYCRHEDVQRNSFVAVARSLIQQILKYDHALINYVFEEAVKSGEVVLTTKKVAKQLLQTCLAMNGSYIVLDGLDECLPQEQDAIACWVRRFVDSPAPDSELSRCVILSQDDATTRRLLSSFPTIEISRLDVRRDIHAYCEHSVIRLKSQFNLSEQQTASVVAQTVTNSDGMLHSDDPAIETCTDFCRYDALCQACDEQPGRAAITETLRV